MQVFLPDEQREFRHLPLSGQEPPEPARRHRLVRVAHPGRGTYFSAFCRTPKRNDLFLTLPKFV